MLSESIPLLLLPGMTADYPVYSRLLPFLPNARVVDFIDPQPGESLAAYAERMADRFPSRCFIAGVSFGGILALEIARLVQPLGCILISSVRRPNELPPWFRACRVLGGPRSSRVLQLVGNSANVIPQALRTSSTVRVSRLAGSAGSWHRWATAAVLDWQPGSQPLACPVLQIHGTADKTFPIRYTTPDVIIEDGQHALPMSHAAETADAIKKFMAANACDK